jgi:esterase/lipase
LILHAENDTVVPINQMQKIYDNIENNEKKFIIVKNGSYWFLSSKINDEVIDEIKKFTLYKIN